MRAISSARSRRCRSICGIAFLAIDEIQLCADPERGHVFTDRLLHARGEEETMFLGADTMRGAIQRFVPRHAISSRGRASPISPIPATRSSRACRAAPPSSAFSAEDVYGIAELVRRQRGGAAVVLGALSPRTRNAQVELYQNGEVDFLVATDAIGMGLNMDVDHVAFAALDKFDGVGVRPLRPDEIGQIAGRAGRHMNDGTFGVDRRCRAARRRTRQRASKAIATIRCACCNGAIRALDFHSLDATDREPRRAAARARPRQGAARRCDLIGAAPSARGMDDVRDTRARAAPPCSGCGTSASFPISASCRAKSMCKLVHTIFAILMSDDGVLPDDWLARQIERLDVTEGDVATLVRPPRADPHLDLRRASPGLDAGQPRIGRSETRAVEDRLSDALHEQLTQRFIDRRTSVLMKRLRDDDAIDLTLDDSGGVVDRRRGRSASSTASASRPIRAPKACTAARCAPPHCEAWKASSSRARGASRTRTTRRFTLSEHGQLWWDGAVVAQLVAGRDAARAATSRSLADEQLRADLREGVQRAARRPGSRRASTTRLEPLLALAHAPPMRRPARRAPCPRFARGIAHQLCENFGSLDRTTIALPDEHRRR